MSNTCEHCGAHLTRPNLPLCPTCRRPLRKQNGKPNDENHPHLVIQEADGRLQDVSLAGPLLTIGRALTNDLVLTHPAVSREHAQIELRGSDYWIIDLNSTNGLSINGRPVHSQALHDGDVIQIIDQQQNAIRLTFYHSGHNEPGAPAHAGSISLADLNLGRFKTFTVGRDPDNQVRLEHPAVSRRHARFDQTPAGYQVRDLNSSNGTFVNGQPVLNAHPVYLNDVVQIGPFKLIYGQAGFARYTPAGNYRLDAIGLTYVIGQARVQNANGRAPRFILRNIDLSIQPREFVALVGASGAGKSTLLNALSGFAPVQKGRVYLNGDDLYSNFNAYRSILGYVPQDDIIHAQLSVRSALTYAARLRLPDAGPAEIEQRIEHVLQEVELTGHETQLVRRLSGGQRKRVSIAVELLADPGLFFLDEPTSGLDPGLEKRMMHLMRRLADGGRTIILSTHTTASLAACNQVAFMADGFLVYFGPPHEMLPFFQAASHTEIYERLAHPIRPARQQSDDPQGQPAKAGLPKSAAEAWARGYQASRLYQKYITDRIRSIKTVSPTTAFKSQPLPRSVSGWQQFWILVQRYFDLITRDAISLFVLMAVMPIIGSLLWFAGERYDLVGKDPIVIEKEIQAEIKEQREAAERGDDGSDDGQYQASYLVTEQSQRVLFIMALAASLLGIFAAAYEITKEESIYRRERMINLKIIPYLLSKVGVLACFALLQCLLFLLVVRLRLLYPAGGVFLPAPVEMMVTLFLAALANIGLGLFISAIVRSSGPVVYIILIVLFFQIIFAQAIFDLPAVVRPLSYLTTTRWTLEALGSSVDMPGLKDRESACIEFAGWKRTALELLEEADPPCHKGQVKQVIDYEFRVNYQRDGYPLLVRWSVLIEFTLVFLALTSMAQKRKDVI